MNSILNRITYLVGRLVYEASTGSFFLLARLLSPFNTRAKKLINGQENALSDIKRFDPEGKPVIWFHVASLGEFEQGRPVMEALKKEFKNIKLVVTFFSPSGYENRKSDPLCDACFYLPFESSQKAETVVQHLQPMAAFWVKYDFWYHYLNSLRRRNIPVFLIAASFRPNQLFFKSYGVFSRRMLACFTHIFCQNETSIHLIRNAGITTGILTGDTRYDRVSKLRTEVDSMPAIETFCNGCQVLILGSCYTKEAAIAAQLTNSNKNLKLILVPHFVDEAQVSELKSIFPQHVMIDNLTIENASANQVLIVNKIGLLSRLYRFASYAFIGGGFKKGGLHNTLEAVAYGLPVCFGPEIKKFPEAYDLLDAGLATIIFTEPDLQKFTAHFSQQTTLNDHRRIAIDWMNNQRGATEKMMQTIREVIKKAT